MDNFDDADPSSADWEGLANWEGVMEDLEKDGFRAAHLREAWDLILVPADEEPVEHINWLLSEYDPYQIVYGLTAATCALTAFARAVGLDPAILARKHLNVFQG